MNTTKRPNKQANSAKHTRTKHSQQSPLTSTKTTMTAKATDIMDVDEPTAAPATSEEEPRLPPDPPEEPWIPTAINPRYFDITVQLPEDKHQLAKTPFLKFDGEGNKYVHDSLRSANILIGKLRWKTPTLAAAQLNLCAKPGHPTNIWTTSALCVLSNELDDESILSHDEQERLKIFFSRLSYTNPGKIVTTVKHNKTPPNSTSRAWRAAIDALGSHYAKATGKQKKNGDIRTHFSNTDTPTKPHKGSTAVKDTSETDNNKNKAKSTDTTTAQSSKASTSKNKGTASTETKSKKTKQAPTAKSSVADKTYMTRVNFMVKIPASDGTQGANAYVLEWVTNCLEKLQDTDDTVIMIPWKEADMVRPAILNPDAVPDKLSDFRVYTESIKPKSKSTTWFKCRFAHNGKPDDLTSNSYSDNQDWFEDHDSQSFYCSVQNSDNTIPLGDFLYSGQFIDPKHLADSIIAACYQATGKTFKLGCRIRKSFEIPLDDTKYRDWTMAENQIVHLECDKAEAKMVKCLIYKMFNKEKDPAKIPGGTFLRLAPDKKLLAKGSKGDLLREAALAKHAGAIRSLNLLRLEDVLFLDLPLTAHGETWTLRTLVKSFTTPLVPKPDQPTKPLFHSIDKATKGRDEEQRVVYLTAYNERITLARSVVEILPAIIFHLLGAEALKKWFKPTAMEAVHDVEFGYDTTGNWDGTWTTQEDMLNQAILDEDIGASIEFDLTEFQHDANEDTKNLVTADEVSLASFGDAFGAQSKPTQESASDSPPADDAATTTVSGGSSV